MSRDRFVAVLGDKMDLSDDKYFDLSDDKRQNLSRDIAKDHGLTHLACDSAHSFIHHQDLSYQIFELEDSGLPQQGILPISARKTITKAYHRCLEKDSFHCALCPHIFLMAQVASNKNLHYTAKNLISYL